MGDWDGGVGGTAGAGAGGAFRDIGGGMLTYVWRVLVWGRVWGSVWRSVGSVCWCRLEFVICPPC